MYRRVLLAVLAGTAMTAGVREAFTQSHASAQGLGATVAPLGLKGYDPVAYFTQSRPVMGNPDLEVVQDGVRYRFATAEHRTRFRADPDRYLPQFGGSCAMNMANGVRREADPTIWRIVNGNLYVFASSRGAERFQDEQEAAARAATNWRTLKDAPSQ